MDVVKSVGLKIQDEDMYLAHNAIVHTILKNIFMIYLLVQLALVKVNHSID